MFHARNMYENEIIMEGFLFQVVEPGITDAFEGSVADLGKWFVVNCSY